MTTHTRNRLLALFALFLFIVVATPAAAQGPYRARLSRDLVDRLQRRVEAPIEIILSAGDVDRIVHQYGVHLQRRLQNGDAVIEATGGQIDAISQDPGVAHVSSNAIVHRMMAVTTAATGADQVWAGVGDLPGFSGRGITVAVIDSGVANHPALRDRIVVSR